MKEYDIIVIGGGLSGMTSALVALNNKIKNILIIERESSLGGILNQCISNRYGEKLLGVKLTGPEYTCIIGNMIRKENVEIKLNSEVINVEENKEITYVNPKEGVKKVKGKTIILATGCREKLTGNIIVPLNRFTGIYTIGNAQKVIVLEGYLPGKNPIVVANCNWALSVARRLVIEGAKISAVIIDDKNNFYINDYYRQIFNELNVTVIENSRIEEIFGNKRVEGVRIYSSDTNKYSSIACDSLILSVGYLPEISTIKNTSIELNEDNLAPKVNNYETSIPGIFACGNLLYGIDALKQEDIDGIDAGKSVVNYLKSNFNDI